MPRLRLRAKTSSLELDLLIATLPEVLRGLRGWRFEDGVVQDPLGRPCERLQLVAGGHAQPGARYRLELPAGEDSAEARPATTAEQLAALVQARRLDGFAGVERWVLSDLGAEPAEPGEAAEPTEAATHARPSSAELELVQDDREAVRMALHLKDVPPVEVALLHPDRPQALRVDGRVEPADTGFFSGPATLSGVLQLDALPPHETATPQLDADLVHRRGSARLRVRLSRGTGDQWEVAGELRLRGRGLLRLPVALSGPVLRHYLNKHAPEIEQALAESAGWRADAALRLRPEPLHRRAGRHVPRCRPRPAAAATARRADRRHDADAVGSDSEGPRWAGLTRRPHPPGAADRPILAAPSATAAPRACSSGCMPVSGSGWRPAELAAPA
ncbi:MAG: hypothetical protein KY451_10090 [Actinobacteria bacterium]|nr:hypothetical protein [Actinomycetota bacterium]